MQTDRRIPFIEHEENYINPASDKFRKLFNITSTVHWGSRNYGHVDWDLDEKLEELPRKIKQAFYDRPRKTIAQENDFPTGILPPDIRLDNVMTGRDNLSRSINYGESLRDMFNGQIKPNDLIEFEEEEINDNYILISHDPEEYRQILVLATRLLDHIDWKNNNRSPSPRVPQQDYLHELQHVQSAIEHLRPDLGEEIDFAYLAIFEEYISPDGEYFLCCSPAVKPIGRLTARTLKKMLLAPDEPSITDRIKAHYLPD